MRTLRRHTKKIIILLLGIAVGLIGVVLLFYPGPGILVIFASLAILATEFDWAHGVLQRLRQYYERWAEWLRQSNWWVRLAVASVTFFVVILTIWVFNGYGLLSSWLRIDVPWLRSPFLS